MQPNFTLKRGLHFFKLSFMFLTLFWFSQNQINAQTLTTESGTGYTATNSRGNVNSQVSFIIENTNAFPVVLNQVDSYFDPGVIGGSVTGSAITLWYSSTSLSGPMTTTGPTWQIAGSGTLGTVSAAGYYTAISGMSFSIPASTTYRFAFQSSLGISYSNPGATPNTFTSGGVSLKVGDFQISGVNIGYAGDFPGPATQFNPRFFTGRVVLTPVTTACSGTPAPGNTISSVTTVCPAINFNLSLQNATAGTGVTYQWQTGTSATGPWTNAGPNAPSWSTTQAAATWYRCQVTCSGNTGTSTPVQVALTPPSGCYCAAGATSTSFEKIARVQFNTIDNSSTATGGYENFTTISTDVIKGQTLPITVTSSDTYTGDKVFVWIDFNQNGSFTDPGEAVYAAPSNSAGPFTGNVTIPAGALTGSTRMRIRIADQVFGTQNNTPCGNTTYGQVEDYTVNVIPCTPLSFTSNPTNASTVCGGNATFSATVTGSAPSYVWEYRANGAAPWQFVPNTAPFSGINTNTLTITEVTQNYSGYQFRLVVQGACTATDFSGTATLTVNSIVAVVNPSSATICVGAIQQLSLTNSISDPVTVSFTNNTPLAIPDATPAGVYSTIAVAGIPAGSIITNMSVKLNATHTFVGDLEINLIGPNNVSLNLIGELDNGTGSNGSDNFVNTVVSSSSVTPMSGAPAPRTGTFAADRLQGYGPSGNYQTSANGMPWSAIQTIMNGNWQLGLSDWYNFDTGTLQDWTLTITYKAPVFAQGTWTGPAGTMFTNAAATTPYTGTPATTIYVKPTATGVNNYNVSFMTATPCTSATTTVPVTVHSAVTGLTSSPASRSVCLGGNTTYTASTTGGTPVNYQWQLSTDGGVTWSNISGETSATLAVNGVTNAMNGNRYRVTTTGNVCGTYNSAASTLAVWALPVATLTAPDLALTPPQTTVVTGSSTPAAASAGWAWTLNGSAISGTSNTQNVSIDLIGSYQATVTDINGCKNKSNILVIGSESSDRLWIYPNPTNGAFQVRLYYDSDVTERRIVTIYNAIGQAITSKHFTLADNTAPYLRMDFDLTNMQAGTYVVKVAQEYSGKVVSGLVIVQ